MNASYDNFIRTTDEDHEKQVQKIFKRLYDQGDIYKGYYEGMYCTPCESFFTESQLVDGIFLQNEQICGSSDRLYQYTSGIYPAGFQKK